MTSAGVPHLGTRLNLRVLDTRLAICRLASGDDVPPWAVSGELVSVTRTREELSVVCPESSVPAGVRVEAGWRALEVEGPLDFDLTGVLDSVVAPLASASISIFALSTFDTDYVLIRDGSLDAAVAVLAGAGHTVL